MAIDRQLRMDICREVKAAMERQLDEMNEKWIGEAELLATFQMFTKSWLRYYGYTLPRTRAVVLDEEGNKRQTSWVYAKNEIQKMILDNRICRLKVKKVY